MLTDPRKIRETKAYPMLMSLYVTFVIILIAAAGRLSIFNLPFIGPVFYGTSYFLMPFVFFMENLIAEVYGYERSRRATQLSILCSLLYILYLLFTTALPIPPSLAPLTHSFNQVFWTLPRHYLAFIAAWYSGSLLNQILLVKFKVLLQGRHFLLRAMTSVFFGELLYQIIGSLISRLGTLNLIELFKYDVFAFSSKIIFELIFAPALLILCRKLKNYEQIDAYDDQTNLNPFRLRLNHD
jgi:uncharacterized PurR-regulated membrane protein YhhQ (DUF165 family)